MLTILNCTQEKVNETQFGIVPVGSVLSYQCSLIPPDFNIYSSLAETNSYITPTKFTEYPSFLFQDHDDMISAFVTELMDVNKIKILNDMKVSKEDVCRIESTTREQANSIFM